MAEVSEGLKVVLSGDASGLEKASASGAASIGAVLKAAQKVSGVDPFKGLTQSAARTATGISAIAANLKPFEIKVGLPDFRPLQSLVNTTSRDLLNSFRTALPEPDTRGFSRAMVGIVQTTLTQLDSLRNARIDMGRVQPPSLEPLRRAIEIAKADLSQAVIVRFPPVEMPRLTPVTVPPVVTTAFNNSITTLAQRVGQVNGLLSQVGIQVTVPPVVPPDLSSLREAVDRAKKDILSVGITQMPPIQVANVPPLDTRAFDRSTLSIAQRVQQVNSLFAGVADTPINAPAVIPFDTRPLQRAVDVTKQQIATVQALRLPPIDTPGVERLNLASFDASILSLRQSVERANTLLRSVDTTIPAVVLPAPDLRPLQNAVAAAKAAVNSIVTPSVPPLALTAFATSADNLQNRVAQVNGLLASIGGKPILLPPVPQIPTLQLPPLDATNYLNDVKTALAEIRADAAKGVLFKIDTSEKTLLLDVENIIKRLNAQRVQIPLSIVKPDFSDTKKAINEIRNDFTKAFITKVPDIGNPYISVTAGVKELAKQGAALVGQNTNVGKSFGEIKRGVAGAGTSLSTVKKGSDTAAYALTALGQTLSDLPFGLIAIQNNMTGVVDAFSRVRKESGSVGGALKTILGTLASGGGLGFAFSAVTAAATFAVQGFGAWTRGIGGAADAAKEANKDIKEVGKSFSEVAAGFAADGVSKIEVFRTALTNVNVPLAERSKILDSYNKLVDKQNELSAKDLTNIDKVNAAVNRQIDIFQRRAIVMAAQGSITDLFKDLFKQQFDLTKSSLGVAAAQNKAGKSFDLISGGVAEWGKNLDTVNKTIKKQPKYEFLSPEQMRNLKDSTTGLTFLEQSLGRLSSREFVVDANTGLITNKADISIGKIRDIRSEIKDLLAFINNQAIGGGVSVLPGLDDTKAKKDNTDLAKLLEERQGILIEYRARFANIGIPFPKFALPENNKLLSNDLLRTRLQMQFQAFDIPIDVNVIPNIQVRESGFTIPKFLDTLKQKMDSEAGKRLSLSDSFSYDNDRKKILDNYRKVFEGLGKKMPEMIESGGVNEIGIPFKIRLDEATNLNQLDAGLNKAAKGVKQTLTDINQVVEVAIREMMVNSLAGIGELIGTALAGGDIESAFKGIFAGLGSTIANLGKQIIAMSPLIQAVQTALATLQPGAMLAAGIGLVAVGTAIKTAFSNASKFAEGGVVPGGFSNDRFPAWLTSGETIIPAAIWPKIGAYMAGFVADQMPRPKTQDQAAFIRDEPREIVFVSERLRGNDMVLQFSRTQRTQNRMQ